MDIQSNTQSTDLSAPSETSKTHKPSIFTCKTCKSSEIKVERKPKTDAQ